MLRLQQISIDLQTMIFEPEPREFALYKGTQFVDLLHEDGAPSAMLLTHAREDEKDFERYFLQFVQLDYKGKIGETARYLGTCRLLPWLAFALYEVGPL